MIKLLVSRFRWRKAIKRMQKRKEENRKQIARTLGRI